MSQDYKIHTMIQQVDANVPLFMLIQYLLFGIYQKLTTQDLFQRSLELSLASRIYHRYEHTTYHAYIHYPLPPNPSPSCHNQVSVNMYNELDITRGGTHLDWNCEICLSRFENMIKVNKKISDIHYMVLM